MKSIGDTLRTAREEGGISLDQAVHDTNISRSYLIALEEERFEVFIADTYLIGFLRNYSSFLGIDTDEILRKYRDYKLNESPTPIEQLIGPPKHSLLKKFILWFLCLAILVTTAVLGLPKLMAVYKEFRIQRNLEKTKEVSEPREVLLSTPLWEGEVHPGDVLVLKSPQGEQRITLSNGDNRLNLNGGTAGNWSMVLGEELYLPDENGHLRWRIYLRSFGTPENGVFIETQQLPELPAEGYRIDETIILEPPSGIDERGREPKVLLSATTPYRFTVNIVFRKFCLFRYKVDENEPLEKTFADGDNLQLEADKAITIWASNAGAAYIEINKEEIRFGGRGEVVVGLIRWSLDEGSEKFNLTQFALY